MNKAMKKLPLEILSKFIYELLFIPKTLQTLHQQVIFKIFKRFNIFKQGRRGQDRGNCWEKLSHLKKITCK